MVFSSLLFLFAYLAVTMVLYYLMPNTKIRNWVLFILSLLFYGWGEPVYILVMLLSILEAYVLGFFIAKHKDTDVKRARIYLVISLALNLLSLLFFKYCNFFIENLRLIPFLTNAIAPIEGLKLPIGISFYTFQIMSYTIDLYRGQTDVQKNFVAFGAYVTLFPQLIAGPIVRYRDVDDQLSERKENMDLFASGVRRFITGIAKKVIIGDAAAAFYEYFKAGDAFADSVVGAWMVMICYTLHIYYDFSGYSDMAIGLGKIFAFDFKENFDYPYISCSVTEFWRRWHISLGTWFRDYVYIPLGGSRVKTKRRLVLNLAVVWILTGVWHGAAWNFLFWGVWFFVLLTLEKLCFAKQLKSSDQKPFLKKLPGWLYAMTVVLLGWVLFRAETLPLAGSYLVAMLGAGAAGDTSALLFLTQKAAFYVSALLFAAPVVPSLRRHLDAMRENARTAWLPVVCDVLYPPVMLTLFLVCSAYLLKSSYNPFIYYNF